MAPGIGSGSRYLTSPSASIGVPARERRGGQGGPQGERGEQDGGTTGCGMNRTHAEPPEAASDRDPHRRSRGAAPAGIDAPFGCMRPGQFGSSARKIRQGPVEHAVTYEEQDPDKLEFASPTPAECRRPRTVCPGSAMSPRRTNGPGIAPGAVGVSCRRCGDR